MARYGSVNPGSVRAISIVSGFLALAALVSLAAPARQRRRTSSRARSRRRPSASTSLALGYGYSWGNVLFDPAIPITDGDANVHSLIGAYVRTINFFGMSGKLDAVVPYAAHGKWTGLVDGVPDSTTRSGFGDPSFRLSVNFIGAPALDLPDFARHKFGTIVGASLQVRAPLGEYDPAKLINLGSNRWTFKPRVGISQPFGPWIVEGHVTAWLFTDNPDALGYRLSQDPLWAIDGHLARLFGKGIWAFVDLGSSSADAPPPTVSRAARFEERPSRSDAGDPVGAATLDQTLVLRGSLHPTGLRLRQPGRHLPVPLGRRNLSD